MHTSAQAQTDERQIEAWLGRAAAAAGTGDRSLAEGASRNLARAAAMHSAAAAGLPADVVDAFIPANPAHPQIECTDLPPLLPEHLGVLHARALDRLHRKREGVYYTPPELVEPTVRRTLQHLGHAELDRVPAVCDPACGGGAFLVGAARALRASGCDPSRALHGLDLDPTAAEIARAAVWIALGDPRIEPPTLIDRIRVGDAVFGAWGKALGSGPTDARDRDAFCAAHVARDLGLQPFHWELEFPAVFERGGFDAVVGNPPWDIRKPDTRAFFGAVDPGFGQRAKQSAVQRMRALCDADPDLAARWERETARHAALSQWVRNAGSPFERQGRTDPNQYKVFTELAWHLVRPGGRFGLLLPAGVYADRGTQALRDLLLDDCAWEWLFGFENRRRLFPIDGRFKFCVVVATRGRRTESVRTAFMQTDAASWAAAEPAHLELGRAALERLSPRSRAVPELECARDAAVLDRVHAAAQPFGDALENGLTFRRELDLTTDSERFPTRDAWERDGYVPDVYDRWVRPRGKPRTTAPDDPTAWLELRDRGAGPSWIPCADVTPDAVALPLYEGRMLGMFDYAEKGWVAGRGRRAEWRDLTWHGKQLEPQYLLPATELPAVDPQHDRPKLGFMAIGSATNTRTMIASSLFCAPCGNAVPTLRSASIADDLCVLAVLTSLVYDWALRRRLGGNNLNRFVLAETPVLAPERRALLRATAAPLAAELAWPHPRFAAAWLGLQAELDAPARWRTDPASRAGARVALDALVAWAFDLDPDDLAWILRECDHPAAALRDRDHTRALDPKGFWRVDRDLEPAARQSVRSLAALEQLGEMGHVSDISAEAVAAWIAQHCGAAPAAVSPETLRSHAARQIPVLPGHDADSRRAVRTAPDPKRRFEDRAP